MNTIVFPAEWHLQSAVQLTWPHEDTDWQPLLDEVIPCFISITKEVMKHEMVLIVCADERKTRAQLGAFNEQRVIFREIKTNDTWARDHGGITTFDNGMPVVNDFVFNGWGMKFPANYDNQIVRKLFCMRTFASNVVRKDLSPFVLEGGSIESDGRGTLLTTTACLCSANRNSLLSKAEIEKNLCAYFGATRILWLENGYLAGDDTDCHIDTLARFCNAETIVYVQCADPSDEHFSALQAMEEELKSFRTPEGKPYHLIPLPMADPIVWEGERLPATYANFLIINGAVLFPCYGSAKDKQVHIIMQTLFGDREIIGINCLTLLKQHGSLHCVTMQYPAGCVETASGRKI